MAARARARAADGWRGPAAMGFGHGHNNEGAGMVGDSSVVGIEEADQGRGDVGSFTPKRNGGVDILGT